MKRTFEKKLNEREKSERAKKRRENNENSINELSGNSVMKGMSDDEVPGGREINTKWPAIFFLSLSIDWIYVIVTIRFAYTFSFIQNNLIKVYQLNKNLNIKICIEHALQPSENNIFDHIGKIRA